MKVVIDTLDLSKYDKAIDQVLQDLIDDLIKIAKETKEKSGVSDTVMISHFRYALLKATMNLSISTEKKILGLIEDADNELFKGLFT